MIPSRFRKRPVVVEAMQITAKSRGDILEWIQQKSVYAYLSAHGIIIGTLEGQMHALPGDWVVRGVHGEFYPVKNDIFWETYEAVEEDVA